MSLACFPVTIGPQDPKAGLSIRTLGDYSTSDGNTYWIPEGQWSTVWNHANDIISNRDYWVGFAGGYHQSNNSVNISLAPNRGNFNAQQGMYISGEGTASSTADLAIGKILGGDTLGISTLASTGKRATKSELFRIKADGKVGIGTNSPSFFTHIQGDGVTNDVLKITARGGGQMVNIQNHSNVASVVRFSNYLGNAFWDAQYNTDNSFSLDYNDSEKFRINSTGEVLMGGTSCRS